MLGKLLAKALMRLSQLHPPGHSLWGEKRVSLNTWKTFSSAPEMGQLWPFQSLCHDKYQSLYLLYPAWGYSISLNPSKTNFMYLTLLKALAPFIVTVNDDNR